MTEEVKCRRREHAWKQKIGRRYRISGFAKESTLTWWKQTDRGLTQPLQCTCRLPSCTSSRWVLHCYCSATLGIADVVADLRRSCAAAWCRCHAQLVNPNSQSAVGLARHGAFGAVQLQTFQTMCYSKTSLSMLFRTVAWSKRRRVSVCSVLQLTARGRSRRSGRKVAPRYSALQ